MTSAAHLFQTATATNAALVAATRKCQFLSFHKGADPFLVHAEQLAALKATAEAANAKWIAATKTMTAEEIVGVITGAGR